MENVGLHGVKPNSCPKCKVLLWEFRKDAKYSVRDYTEYEYCEQENGLQSPGSDSDDADDAYMTLDTLRVNMEPSVFHGPYRVSAPDLQVPDLLHTIYLRLFKHMMDWIQGFLKKHGRFQAFDDAWKTLPPYSGFFMPKKADREVCQWQEKEMRNLGRCLLGVLAVALRQPDSTQVIPFKRALKCVRALVDFNMMAQYCSRADETMAYMEDYLGRFHQMKDIFLEFRESKRTQAKIDEERKELRHQRAQINQRLAPSKRRQVRDQDREKENDQSIDLIHSESHFNFIKMHLLIHFSNHIRQFGNIPMYSPEYGELAHKEPIKDPWRRSNKNDMARQILHS